MSANVENMMSVREKPWHGLGTIVETAPSSAEAISLAGLDWKVVPEKVYLENGQEIPMLANVRETDKQFYGIVTGKYKIIQNAQAFDFVDSLSTQGLVRYETAGSLAYGKKVFMTVKLNETRSILGDNFDNYLVLTNSHDGKGAVKVAVSPIRVVCQNTLNLALETATNTWSIRHFGNIEEKMKAARETITHAIGYLDNLEEYAELMEQKTISYATFREMLEIMYPIDAENDSKTVITNKTLLRESVENAYNMADISQFKGTAWGVINAVSDVVGHREPHRKTATFAENRFEKVINGDSDLYKAQELLMTA